MFSLGTFTVQGVVMDQLDELARIDLIWVGRNGDRRSIIVEMGKPVACETGEWKCPVNLSGIDDRTRVIRGEDAFQAICLTLRHIAYRLDDLRDDGGRLLQSEGGDFPLDAYFGEMLQNR